MAHNQNKKLVYCHINESSFFILIANHVSNFHLKDNGKD